jgi:hypothetical protein
MPMTRTLFTALMCIFLNAPAADVAAQAEPAPEPSPAAVKKALKGAHKSGGERRLLRIGIEGQLAPGLTRLDIYGRGVGIWNDERQFKLEDKAVREAVDLLLKADFAAMPDRFAFGGSDDQEKPVQLLRVITVDVGGLSKTVTQDSKGPISVPFEKLITQLVALCRKPSQSGLGASSLDDGLRKVADGTLIPEAMRITVNAPQLRSLASQTGQGWLMTVRQGALTLQSHVLDRGYKTVVDRPITTDETRALARELLDDKVSELPANVNTQGHTQLMVGVLNHRIDVMARPFASPEDAAAMATEQAFGAVRKALFEFYKMAVQPPSPQK